MMYHSDGRRHRQSLVYFGEPQDSSANVAAAGCKPAGFRRTEYVSTYRTSREANRRGTLLSAGAPSVRCHFYVVLV